MKNIQGWAHLCFFSPFADNDGAFYEFRGHVISSTNPTTSLGIAGVHLPHHVDPHQNDCMDPHVFYHTTIKTYDDNNNSTNHTLVVRRVIQDDAAGLFTEPYDNQGEQSLLFETEKFLVGKKAVDHVKEYLGHDVLKKNKMDHNNINNKNNYDDNDDDDDVVVCMGKIQIKIK
ncbi:hypothetical protein BDA99DRAFT_85445 [Phascolomyces articulosus]|uniref:Uncharacterized protein n=1 Tax=Phascolomyces articulosus TaxID=60185 RepID=A0AAD5PCS9_9FUNG|nr:hypothetical protein BDA99DRAFT_85445 [Phascolomyces articulosus]